jgi:two-component system sensor histidine kinase RegB
MSEISTTGHPADGVAPPSPGLIERLDRLFGPSVATLRSATPVRIDEEAVKLSWLIRLRWVAVCGQLSVIVPALSLGWLAREYLGAYLATVVGLVVFNLLCMRRLRRTPDPSPNETLLQLTVDLGGLMGLLLLSGGAWNPLAPLVFIHAGMGAILLGGVRSLVLVAALIVMSVIISVAPILPPALPIPPTPTVVVVPSFVLVSVVIWALTTWLGRSLESHRRLLLNLQVHQARADRLRAAGALAAGFSHELATPLNTIRLRLDRLGRNEVDPDNRDLVAALEATQKCEAVLQSLVGKQLDPSEARMENVAVVGVVRRACRSWSTDARRADVHDLVHDPLRCEMPVLAFTQALLNLLDNAAEATDMAGRHRVPVDVEIELHDAGFSVAVLDRGVGWPALVRKNIGQPFLTTKAHGNGLGLYNAYTLAVALGGELQLEDRDGGGAIARFVLPIGGSEEFR